MGPSAIERRPSSMDDVQVEPTHRVYNSAGSKIALELIPQIAGCPTISLKKNPTEIFLTLVRLVEELLITNSTSFDQIIHLLSTSPTSGPEGQAVFNSIVQNMLSDGQFNWGRVAALYAFTGHICKKIYAKEGSTREDVDKYADYLAEYVEDHLTERIESCLGGWEKLPVMFPEQPNVERQVWNGLVGTLVGLGLCSLAVIAVR